MSLPKPQKRSWQPQPIFSDLPANIPAPKFRLFQKVRLKEDPENLLADDEIVTIVGMTWLADTGSPAWFYAWEDGVNSSHENNLELVKPAPVLRSRKRKRKRNLSNQFGFDKRFPLPCPQLINRA